MNQILDVVWQGLAVPEAEVAVAAAPGAEPSIEVPPVPELSIASVDAAPEAAKTFFGLPPLPAAMFRPRLKMRAARGSRENPISGTRTWRGKIGGPDWSRAYPIAGGNAEP
jgi:hypothetical protein